MTTVQPYVFNGDRLARAFDVVLYATGIARSELLSERRYTDLAHARFAVMLALRRYNPKVYSYPVLARVLGRKDHSTTHHGCKRAQELCAADENYARFVDSIEAAL